MIEVLVLRRHSPVRQLCTKHHLQGVWWRATPPPGSARGGARSQLRSNKTPSRKRQTSLAGGVGACYAPTGEREGQSPLASPRRKPSALAVG